MIPKIIHQTWKTELIPPEWAGFVASWRNKHSDWEYRLWTNTDGAEFVQEFYPELERTYFAYPHDIQRADAIRYLVVHHYGGFYADLDFECLQPLDTFRDSEQLLIGFEPTKHADQQSRRELLCNALFGSQPKSSFLAAVIDFLISDTEPIDVHDVLATTGPVMLQHVYERTNKQGVTVFPASRFCPFVSNAPELHELAANSIAGKRIRKQLVEAGCYAVHHWANSWLRAQPRAFYNPHPNDINGFHFYPRQDSPGKDLFSGGRDIPVLAERCYNDDRVVAFNTLGFAKYELGSVTDFVSIPGARYNEGLYVKATADDQLVGDEPFAETNAIKLQSVSPRPFLLCLDDLNDAIVSRQIRQGQVWEPITTELMNRLVSSGDTVIDIGAHIGYFTMILSQLVSENGRVYSFEPEGHNFSILQMNTRINALCNVNLENMALSNVGGALKLYLSDYNTGDHRIAPTVGRASQPINCVTLDEYFTNGEVLIDFIKCDTQGHELEVLQGMTRTVELNRERLACLFEYSPGLLQAARSDGLRQLISLFEELSAEIYLIRETSSGQELVLMDQAALYDVASVLLAQQEIDACYDLLIFFSEHARNHYFAKLSL